MKVLLLTDGISPFVLGGMQRHSHYLCKFLVPLGVDITLIHCVADGETPPSDQEVRTTLWGEGHSTYNGRFEQICLHFPAAGRVPGHYVRNSWAYSVQILEKVESRLSEFDVVYAQGLTALQLLKKRKLGLRTPPVIINIHGYEMFQKPANLKARIDSRILRKPVRFLNHNADYVLSFGAKMSELLEDEGIPTEKTVELASGIDPELLNDSVVPGNRKRFVFLGRYERRKGVEELGKALETLLAEQLDFHFDFIGPIPEDKRIVDPRITYHGRVNDKHRINELLRACDVLLCPSHSEGLPNVLFEAMAQGLAIVATDVGATSILVDSSNGILLPESKPELIVSAMREMMEMDGDSLTVLKERSLEKMHTRFNWDVIGREHKEAFESICHATA